MLIYLQMIETPEERDKFEALYMEYRGLMYHIAYDILRNDQDAEDAVHNAFVKIAEYIKNFLDLECPKTKGYIVTIIESRAIDIYRHKQRHPVMSLDELPAGLHMEYTGSNELTKCIASLPPRYRHVLALKHQHGFSNREIAKILDISEANVSKLEQRAKARLRELCAKEGVL